MDRVKTGHYISTNPKNNSLQEYQVKIKHGHLCVPETNQFEIFSAHSNHSIKIIIRILFPIVHFI